MSEKQKPHLLNRILRCSACAKKLLYGILITVGLSGTIFILAVMEIPINPHYVAFGLAVTVVAGLIGAMLYGAYKGFNAYCEKGNLYYDDFIAAIMGFACCFGLFIAGLLIYLGLGEGNFFELILIKAEEWELQNVQ